MPKFKFGKLVRDKIVDHQIASGAKPKYRKLNDAEHKHQLVLKITEEAEEILAAKPEEIAGEIADVQQALDDLKMKYAITEKDVKFAQKAKNKKNGSFKQGIFVESVELSEEDEWVSYYRKNSDRYPEIH